MPRILTGRKLLVASLGVAAVSYAGCSTSSVVGNLGPGVEVDSGDVDDSSHTFGDVAVGNLAAPDVIQIADGPVGNLAPPNFLDAGDASDARATGATPATPPIRTARPARRGDG